MICNTFCMYSILYKSFFSSFSKTLIAFESRSILVSSWANKSNLSDLFIFNNVFLCRGLCSVYRSKAGVTPLEDEAADADDVNNSKTQYNHNVHWLDEKEGNSGPSRYVGYYDAASLYPSSSKYCNILHDPIFCCI